MKPIKYASLDCQTFEEWANGKVSVEPVEDLCHKVPHVGFGGASKSKYVSAKTGNTVYVLERNGMYSCDAYSNDVWLFEADFTAEEADAFLKKWDKNICYETEKHVVVMATKFIEIKETPYKVFASGHGIDDAPIGTFTDMDEAIKWADAQ